MIELPKGFVAGAAACGLKPSGRPDVGIVFTERPAAATGVFTTNRFQAAPVQLTRRHLRRGAARIVVANAGNANACTGGRGLDDARATAKQVGRLAKVRPEQAVVASTGVIGVPLDMAKLAQGIAAAWAARSQDGAEAFAQAICTTDTRIKTVVTRVGGYTVTGIAKGAGMMAPEMATMLAFLFTDAPAQRSVLSEALGAATRETFDLLNLDGCMSTNDTVVVMANGAAGGDAIEPGDARAGALAGALAEVCGGLARAIADDGEGMTKLVTIRVEGAVNPREARRAAHAVANSVLLRCALNGGDPYWGRVLAALGTIKVPFDPNVVDVWMGGEKLCEGGSRGPGDADKARAAFREREIEIVVDMRRGGASATVLSNDLSVEYVRFNTEYTT